MTQLLSQSTLELWIRNCSAQEKLTLLKLASTQYRKPIAHLYMWKKREPVHCRVGIWRQGPQCDDIFDKDIESKNAVENAKKRRWNEKTKWDTHARVLIGRYVAGRGQPAADAVHDGSYSG